MRVVAFVASENGVLSRGDRGAASEARQLGGGEALVLHALEDHASRAYARALGAKTAIWDVPFGGFDVALIGPEASTRLGDAFAGRLAEDWGGALLFDVLSIEAAEQGWTVVADAGRGARDVVSVVGPLIAAISNEAPRPRYVSHFRRGLGRIDTGGGATTDSPADGAASRSTPNALGRAAEWGPVTARPPRRTVNAASAEERTNSAFGIETVTTPTTGVVDDDPAECARILLRYLIHEGFVARGEPQAPPPSTAGGEHREFLAEAKPSPTRFGGDNSDPENLAVVSAALARAPRTLGESLGRIARRPRRVAASEAESAQPVSKALKGV